VPGAPLVSLRGVDWATATATKNTNAIATDSLCSFEQEIVPEIAQEGSFEVF
jgi:hypothetical protein